MGDREVRLVLNGDKVLTVREGEKVDINVIGTVGGSAVTITLATLELLP